jgi:hypothetical protein
LNRKNDQAYVEQRNGSVLRRYIGYDRYSTRAAFAARGYDFFLTSLLAIDVATGWTELQAVWGKGHQRVGAAVHLIRQALPMPLLSLHTDNGSEFLNHILVPWCRDERIAFTRGRPYVPAMRQQIGLQLAGRHIAPFPERPQRDLGAQGGKAGTSRRDAMARYWRRTGPKRRSMVGGLIRTRAVRCCAERVTSSCRSRVSMSSGRKGARRLEQRLVAGFPQLLQHRPQGVQILTWAAGPAACASGRMPQQPDRHFAIAFGDLAELIQETTFATA